MGRTAAKMAKNKKAGGADKGSKETISTGGASRVRKTKAGKIGESIADKDAGKKKDFPTVRSNIAILVGNSAEMIVAKVIEVAKSGQLAQAKYLFEAVGLYPPIEEEAQPEGESLAFTLLQRMGIPTEPINYEEDPAGVLPGFGGQEGLGENEREGKASSPAPEGRDENGDPGDAVK